MVTHVVDNQPPEFAPRDLWGDDVVLRDALPREGAAAFTAHVAAYGAIAGGELLALSHDAHRDRPRLRTHDRFGRRIDVVDFHPNYHRLMQVAVEHGVAGLSWAQPGKGAHVARAALSYLHHQVEPGTSCPLTMTHAAVPVLRLAPRLCEWVDKVASCRYDASDLAIHAKPGVTIGMGMTEKQGGSDVRANTTTATPLADGDAVAGDAYVLRGHKWFFSAPMSDGFLVLAQASGGLSCFLMPRRRSDGTRNAFSLVRLKDKLGDWSNASSEVDFEGAAAWRVGDEGRGVATILQMVMLTRLDCMLGSAAGTRMALAQAIHHCRHRSAFGKRLAEQPLMRNVLADLAVESEAALALAMRVARSVDAAPHDPHEAAFARVATAVGKYWICRRAPALVNEAQECLGGAGYIEDSLLPRLYRQAPLNSIWEGSGNIQCLDVLRALAREPEAGAALLAEIDAARGLHPALDAARAALRLALPDASEAGARLLVERIALALQASVLLRAGSPVAEAFCRSRLGGAHGLAMGTLPAELATHAAIERALPA
ncbi:acyl-CoA dehydrogenase family protein [Luteimonas sp. MC1825]|uniref:acyl-CoA dehydrogenase family protein n=1 Tax=Luteimonas sp. MC1825 TaxID=2761107 RepID=UPI0016080381|nr:acyl-CoA dehydrogenase family protein [Luteimonas sp. MC1825]MBB6599710.1 acyl-CoA dehydrogenase family protein [Luteimonas sp. MC1825]QOC87393.1 acyl-CoA dehydrogenase family protein [Luteimonas sp. MC1825]